VLNKDAAGGPQSSSEHILLGDGRAELEAKRQALQTAPRGETRERNWGLLPKPWDFTPFLVAKLKGFTGR
jgi:hypothetical protein